MNLNKVKENKFSGDFEDIFLYYYKVFVCIERVAYERYLPKKQINRFVVINFNPTWRTSLCRILSSQKQRRLFV